MPTDPGAGFSVDTEVLVNYAGWLEGSSAVMDDCHDLVLRWCDPPGLAYGVTIPFLGETAAKLHGMASAAVRARAQELAAMSATLHGMAVGLAQVSANYADRDVQVVANFGSANDTNERVRQTLPQTYDLELRPHR